MRHLVILALLLAASPASARTWHITPDGLGDAPTIQAGVDSAAAGDTLQLGCGTYSQPELTVQKALVIRGASGNPSCVVLDGHGLQRVLAVEDFVGDLVVEGLTVQNGFAAGAWPAGTGAGVLLSNATASFSECVFSGNSAQDGGAAMCRDGAAVSFRHCSFFQNSAVADGGGLYVHIGAQASVESCDFSHNTGGNRGGAIRTHDSDLWITESSFMSNHSAGGGALYVYRTTGALAASTFDANRAASGTSGNGGAMYVGGTNRFPVTDCAFADNVAASIGGAIYCHESAPPMSSLLFTRNRATHGSGGAITTIDSRSNPLRIDQCVFHDNSAPRFGGAIYALRSSLAIARGSFVGNASGDLGSAIHCRGFSDASIRRSIFAFGGAGDAIHCDGGAELSIWCSDMFGNLGGDWTGCTAGQLGLNGNFSLDPLFCGSAHGNLHLHSTSPCAPPSSGDCWLVGALPVGCGPVAVEPTTWGQIKAAYR